MSEQSPNKTVLVTHPSSERVMLVIGILLDPLSLDIEGALSSLVPEMAKGGVTGGLLVIGDSTLIVRAMGQEVMVDEISTSELLALADIDATWSAETIVLHLQRWISVLSCDWRDRVVGPLRELLVPHIVAGLVGDVEVCDGLWGVQAHRVASTLPS